MNTIGIIGLGTMGAHLARNFSSKGVTVAVYNRTFAKTEELLALSHQKINGYKTVQEFVQSLEKPRKIVLLVTAGKAIDTVLEELIPLLEPEDIVVDGGNSHWKDTERRQLMCAQHNLFLVSCGISGGSEGALNGPSLMPSGEKQALDVLLPLLCTIAAQDFSGKPAVTALGTGTAGHFVKMVHNGIEYAFIQAIAELYHFARIIGTAHETIISIFQQANTGVMNSYLLDITVSILQTEHNGTPLIHRIVDRAKAKGTGAWTLEAALELNVATPTMAQAVFARTQSERTYSFVVSPIDLTFSDPHRMVQFVDPQAVWHTLHAVWTASLLQGVDLIEGFNKHTGNTIDIQEVLRIWQGGCIIRTRFLEQLGQALYNPMRLQSLIVDAYEEVSATMHVFSHTQGDFASPVIHSTYDYLTSLLTKQQPANMIQAMRDYFGEHGYQMIDSQHAMTGGWSADRPLRKLD